MVHRGNGDYDITGNTCQKGEAYARNELTAPVRTITSMIRVSGGNGKVVPVKTAKEIPKGKIKECMEEIKAACVNAPVNVGDILIQNVAGTEIPVIATGNIRSQK